MEDGTYEEGSRGNMGMLQIARVVARGGDEISKAVKVRERALCRILSALTHISVLSYIVTTSLLPYVCVESSRHAINVLFCASAHIFGVHRKCVQARLTRQSTNYPLDLTYPGLGGGEVAQARTRL